MVLIFMQAYYIEKINRIILLKVLNARNAINRDHGHYIAFPVGNHGC